MKTTILLKPIGYMTSYIRGLLLLSTFLFFNFNNSSEITQDLELKPVTYSYTNLNGVGFEKGITRRDPSDVIYVDGVYYVYYTKVIGQASGYWGDLWYATSKDEGYTWEEQGQILGIGEKGKFDSQAVFTPNIIKSNNKYYMFYTGVEPTPGQTTVDFENNSTTDITALGLAVSNKPNGPFTRFSSKPIMEVSTDADKFDSFRIDDASLLYRDGKYFLYYKGRSRSHKTAGPSHTQMGVAFSEKPEGPYIKHTSPLLDRSHEVLIWKQGRGVGALASISSSLEYAHDGLDFTSEKKSLKVKNRPNAPGAFRPDLTGGESNKLSWGISMIHNGPDCYLIRYDVHEKITPQKGTFGYDKDFLKTNYKNTIVLESKDQKASIILSPELQGRVMTSTLDGDTGTSFGWLNYDLIASKEIKKHINPTGGEERFWLGPEGGQFSLYFKPKTTFDFANWFVPPSLDTEAFEVVEKNSNGAVFHKEMNLVNHSGAKFNIDVTRTISLLDNNQIQKGLNLAISPFYAVAYQTSNTIKNIGNSDWKKESGLVSIWLLSMLNPSPETAVVVPIKKGSEFSLGSKVNDNYFGKVSADRLIATERTIFFKADGTSRGKIGVSEKRATSFMGSYDAKNKVLTILEIKPPKKSDRYVNSAWELQENPYSGDVLNSYNDGKLDDGTQMGPFYELESSSPALALKINESYTHIQRMYHFKGSPDVLNQISKKILKVSIEEIEATFK